MMFRACWPSSYFFLFLAHHLPLLGLTVGVFVHICTGYFVPFLISISRSLNSTADTAENEFDLRIWEQYLNLHTRKGLSFSFWRHFHEWKLLGIPGSIAWHGNIGVLLMLISCPAAGALIRTGGIHHVSAGHLHTFFLTPTWWPKTPYACGQKTKWHRERCFYKCCVRVDVKASVTGFSRSRSSGHIGCTCDVSLSWWQSAWLMSRIGKRYFGNVIRYRWLVIKVM